MKVIGKMAKLSDANGNPILPVTSAEISYMDDGVTSVNAEIRQLEDKFVGATIGITGKEYPNLGARLSDEAREIINRLNEGKFNRLSGSSIQAKNTLPGYTKNLEIKGHTLNIITGYKVDTTAFNITSLAAIPINIANNNLISVLSGDRKFAVGYTITISNLVAGDSPLLYI